MKRWLFVLAWAVAAGVHAVVYIVEYSKEARESGIELYAQSFEFQGLAFLVFRLPFWIALLVVALIAWPSQARPRLDGRRR